MEIINFLIGIVGYIFFIIIIILLSNSPQVEDFKPSEEFIDKTNKTMNRLSLNSENMWEYGKK